MANRDEAIDRMTRAALELASERGWHRLSLAEVAARAELPLLDAYRAVPSKTDLLLSLIADTDCVVLAQGVPAPDDPPRDRLFDVLMRRFDALQARRQGTIAILRDLPSDPLTVLCILPRFARSIGWMLEAAGISSSGLAGTARLQGVALVYLDALRVWIKDDSPDMARTMAALDKGLRRAEQVAHSVPFARRRRRAEAPRRDEPPAESAPPPTPAAPA
jgi:AcrR family transcriptional regulator